MEEAMPFRQSGLGTMSAALSFNSRAISSSPWPVTTITGLHLADVAARTARRMSVTPWKGSSCLGRPKRVDPPAARIIAPIFRTKAPEIADDGSVFCDPAIVGLCLPRKRSGSQRQLPGQFVPEYRQPDPIPPARINRLSVANQRDRPAIVHGVCAS